MRCQCIRTYRSVPGWYPEEWPLINATPKPDFRKPYFSIPSGSPRLPTRIQGQDGRVNQTGWSRLVIIVTWPVVTIITRPGQTTIIARSIFLLRNWNKGFGSYIDLKADHWTTRQPGRGKICISSIPDTQNRKGQYDWLMLHWNIKVFTFQRELNVGIQWYDDAKEMIPWHGDNIKERHERRKAIETS